MAAAQELDLKRRRRKRLLYMLLTTSLSENAERSTPDVAQKSVLFIAEGTATAFTGSAGPPIVSTFTRAESRELRGLVTRYANGGDQVLTTRTYHASQAKPFPAKVRIARRSKQARGLDLFSKSVNHFGGHFALIRPWTFYS